MSRSISDVYRDLRVGRCDEQLTAHCSDEGCKHHNEDMHRAHDASEARGLRVKTRQKGMGRAGKGGCRFVAAPLTAG